MEANKSPRHISEIIAEMIRKPAEQSAGAH